MPFEINDMSETEAFDQLLIALVGKEKSGKSRLLATAPKPVLVFDHDGRARSLAGIKGVYAISYIDPIGFQQPDAFTNFVGHLTTLETNGWDLAYLGFKNLEPGQAIVKTVAIDSIQTIAGNAMRYIKATGGKTMGRPVSFGGMTVHFPAGFDAWNAEMATIEDTLLRVFGSKKNVIATFHEVAEEAPDSTIEHPVFTGRVGIFPVRYQRLLKYFNEVWRITRGNSVDGTAQGAIPSVSCVPDYNFALGASALNINAVEVPNIEEMIARHKSGTVKSTAASATASYAQQAPTQSAPQRSLASIPGVVMTSPEDVKK